MTNNTAAAALLSHPAAAALAAAGSAGDLPRLTPHALLKNLMKRGKEGMDPGCRLGLKPLCGSRLYYLGKVNAAN